MNIVLLKHGAGVYLDKGISDSPGRKHKFTTFNAERLQASTFFTLIFDGGGGVDFVHPIFIDKNNRKS